MQSIRAEIGDDYPIILRFSQWKQQDFTARLAPSLEELEQFVKPLSDAGVDIFHCSTRRFWEPEFEGSELNLAGWVKKITGKPTISVGSVGLTEEFIATYRGGEAEVASIDDSDHAHGSRRIRHDCCGPRANRKPRLGHQSSRG